MPLAAFVLLAQTSLTPTVLIDDLTVKYGYGVIGTSISKMPTVTVPDLGNAIDVEVRLKNRWRVVRDKAMPGVFRPEAAPYAEAFEEVGPGVPLILKHSSSGPGTVVTPGPVSEPLPKVDLKDLATPGGVRVSVERLAQLLEVKKEAVPWMYLRRTARVRIDPKNAPEPLGLLAAITGAKVDKERKTLTFDPRLFRTLAVATLREEARLGVREDRQNNELFAQYEADRPFRLALGAEAHAAATDAELAWIYETSGRMGEVKGVNLSGPILRELERKFEKVREAMRSQGEDGARMLELFPDISRPHVSISSPKGYGELGVYDREGKGILNLG